jgi:hypothetical protein
MAFHPGRYVLHSTAANLQMPRFAVIRPVIDMPGIRVLSIDYWLRRCLILSIDEAVFVLVIGRVCSQVDPIPGHFTTYLSVLEFHMHFQPL